MGGEHAALGGDGERRPADLAARTVEHDRWAVAAERREDAAGPVRLGVVDRRDRVLGAYRRELGLAAGRTDHAGAERRRELDKQQPHPARRAGDQHGGAGVDRDAVENAERGAAVGR